MGIVVHWTSVNVLVFGATFILPALREIRMEIHHLNCCPMHPFGKRLINGTGSFFEPANLVTHCLLLEADGRLALVDTGLGRADLEDPSRQGTLVNVTMNPRRSPDPTAATAIESLGYEPADVEHIFLTHLDVDHAGGLADFPGATVHLLRAEYETAQSPPLMEKLRYRKQLWEYDPEWKPHDTNGTDWFGFKALQPLPVELPELRMVPLPGHSAGHCGIAIDREDGWLFHCGDAYFDTREMNPENPRCTPGLRLQQRIISSDNGKRLETQKRLRKLKQQRDEVELICSHSPEEFSRYRSE